MIKFIYLKRNGIGNIFLINIFSKQNVQNLTQKFCGWHLIIMELHSFIYF